MLADWTYRGEGGNFGTNEHGFASFTKFVPMSLQDSFRFYDMIPRTYLKVSNGVETAFEGRIEDRAIVPGGLEVTALGYWRAFTDAPVVAFFSKTGTENFRQFSQEDLPGLANVRSERFEVDNNNRIYIAPRKNEAHGTAVVGAIGAHVVPNKANLTGDKLTVICAWEFKAPNTDWRATISLFTEDGVTGGPALIFNSSAGTQTGAFQTAIAARSMVVVTMYRNTGATYTGETGDCYFKVTDLRMTYDSSQGAGMITASSVPSGTQVVTPSIMSPNLRVGMKLLAGTSGFNTSELVTVEAVTATTFTATFTKSHTAAVSFQTYYRLSDEMVKDLLAYNNGINPLLSTASNLIEAPGVDLTDEVYEDIYPADILTDLTARGDDQEPPRRWEVGVWEKRQLHFRPRASAGQTWYTDVLEFTLQDSLDGLVNSVYAVYQGSDGRTLRTAANDDAASVARHGDLTRRAAVAVRTTSQVRAETMRDTTLAEKQEIQPRFSLTLSGLFTAQGAKVPNWLCRAGDIIVIRNLPLAYGGSIDKIRTFVVASTDYDLGSNTLTPAPDLDLPELGVLVGDVSRRDAVVSLSGRPSLGGG